MVIHDEHLAWEIITLSELGLGMGYVNGMWESDSPYHPLQVVLEKNPPGTSYHDSVVDVVSC